MPQAFLYILSKPDLYLTPLYIFLLFLLVKKLKRKYYFQSPLQQFIFPAFIIHISGSIFFALIYQYYYGYGDTYGYFTGAHETWEAFIKDPKVAFELLFRDRENFSPLALDWAPFSSYTGFAQSTSAVIRIAGFIGLFCFGSYLPIAMVLGLLAFWGTWLIYITINRYFPHLYKLTAVCCLFIPSVVIWSSGVSKEPPCMFALGLCFYSVDKLLNKKGMIKHLLYFAIGASLLIVIKSYIFFTFAAAAAMWAYRFFILRMKNALVRLIFRVTIFIAIFSFFLYMIAIPENSLQQSFIYLLDGGQHLQELMTSINDTYGGSGYTLPPVNLNAFGAIQSYMLSTNVSLFRPYIWECTNILMVMNFIESFGTLLLVLAVLFKAGIRKFFSYCNTYPVLLFMLLFSLIFAPIVGFISFNFGTLVRYKIPFLPFFFSFLIILLFDKKVVRVNAENG
ncbi:MAG: hypothetical protein ABI416_17955 [Ginsengibacter sp.]